MRPTCIAIDFDGTLAYFKGGYDELFAIFSRRGVDHAVVRGCYERTKREFGFSITALTSVVADRTGQHFGTHEVEREFQDWLERSLHPYPDSVVTLEAWRGRGIPGVIVTAGNTDYQTRKVQVTRIPHNGVTVVPHEHGKLDVVRWLLEHHGPPIMLVEDRPSVLDLIRESGLTADEVLTVWLVRPESPYCHETPVYAHDACTTLADIQF